MAPNRILFVASNPDETDPRALAQAARHIALELERSKMRARFEFVPRWAAQPLDLLNELRKVKPRVVHFSGHSRTQAPTSAAHEREVTGDFGAGDSLLFQDHGGRPRAVSASALQQAFGTAGTNVKVVLLDACYNEQTAHNLLAHVDCVVGMPGSGRNDQAATSFARGFYAALGHGESVGAAFRDGCAAIQLEGHSDPPTPQIAVRPQVDVDKLIIAARIPTVPTGTEPCTDPASHAGGADRTGTRQRHEPSAIGGAVNRRSRPGRADSGRAPNSRRASIAADPKAGIRSAIPLDRYDEWMLFMKIITSGEDVKIRLERALKALDDDIKRKVRYISRYQLYGSWDVLVRFALVRGTPPAVDIAEAIADRVKLTLGVSDPALRDHVALRRIESIEYLGPHSCGGHFIWHGHTYDDLDMQRAFIIARKADDNNINPGEWASIREYVEQGIATMLIKHQRGVDSRSYWTLHRERKSIVIEGLFHSNHLGDLRCITKQLAKFADAPHWIRETHIGYGHKEWTFGRFSGHIVAARKKLGEHHFVRHGQGATLAAPQLLRWLCGAAKHCELFPNILENALRLLNPHPMIYQVLERNLADEIGRADPAKAHHRQYISLAESLGRKTELTDYRPGKRLADSLDTARQISRSTELGEVFGYVLVNEELISTVFEAVKQAFSAVHPGVDTSFFEEHIAVDEHHVKQLRAGGDQLPEPVDDDVERGIGRGLDALIALLDEAYDGG